MLTTASTCTSTTIRRTLSTTVHTLAKEASTVLTPLRGTPQILRGVRLATRPYLLKMSQDDDRVEQEVVTHILA